MTTLSDDRQVTPMNGEVEPPCKKPRRLQDQTHFIQLKLHTRLVIYDYVDLNDFEDCDDGTVNFLYCDSDLNDSYARMTVVASILGDLHTLQYLAEIPDNKYIPQNYEVLLSNVELEADGRSFDGFDMGCVCYILASSGNWKALKWAISHQYPHENWIITGALHGGADIEMLQWLHSHGCLGDIFTFTTAIRHSYSWDILKYLHQINCPWELDNFAEAVYRYDLDVIRWLKANNCPWNKEVFHRAIERGDFKILVWLRMEGCPWDSEVFNYAIGEGTDLFTLQWFLHEDTSLMNSVSFNYAICRGDMDVLELLRTKNCPMSTYNFIYAIKRKVTMDVLEWMYHAKFPLKASTFVHATERGDLELMTWLLEKKCPWNSRCFKVALNAKRFDIVKWLHEESCPQDEETSKFMMKEFFKLYEEQKAP